MFLLELLHKVFSLTRKRYKREIVSALFFKIVSFNFNELSLLMFKLHTHFTEKGHILSLPSLLNGVHGFIITLKTANMRVRFHFGNPVEVRRCQMSTTHRATVKWQIWLFLPPVLYGPVVVLEQQQSTPNLIH